MLGLFKYIQLHFGSRFFLGLCLLFLLPTYFINNKNTHDWGGDFALYIQQAKLISNGQDLTQNHYLFNDEHNRVGPKVYPVGFSILLLPIYKVFGNDICAFTSLISFFYILMGILSFIFFKSRLGPFYALLLVLILFYNPLMLQFKLEVMSEIPFAVFLLLTVLLFDRYRSNLIWAIGIGVLLGFTVSIRSIGWALLAAIPVFYLLNRKLESLKNLSVIFGVGILSALTINQIFIGNAVDSGYTMLFDNYNFLETFYTNLQHSFMIFEIFFGGKETHVLYLIVLLEAAGLIFALVAIINKIATKSLDYADLVYLGSMILILVFPYSTVVGIRYTIPILPFLLYYTVLGLAAIDLKVSFSKKIMACLLFLLIGMVYQPEIAIILDHNKSEIPGPLSQESIECFKMIKSDLPENAVILFQKPRVLGLYADRDSWSIRKDASQRDLERQKDKFKCSFVLSCKQLMNPAIDQYVAKHQNKHEVWSNEQFTLIKI
ncbi:DUF2079 domain-containing protein [Flavobacteriales bacterium]|nr:DUF2079 domain-containing protein [Flavobacteriales bacterium]